MYKIGDEVRVVLEDPDFLEIGEHGFIEDIDVGTYITFYVVNFPDKDKTLLMVDTEFEHV